MKPPRPTYTEAGAWGGSTTSPTKRRASRDNGALGGHPPIWRCPDCDTTGLGGDTARKCLQITYRAGKVIKIVCRVCGAQATMPSAFKRWLVDA